MFVFAVTADLKRHIADTPTILCSPRLYSFPTEPDPPAPASFLVLDSGAWGMSKRGRAIDEFYMRDLAIHYQYYQQRWRGAVHCIAPDVYLAPKATVANYKVWRQRWGVPVVPVIQFERVGRLDMRVADWQARFYAPTRPPWLAISNPALRASEAGLMATITRLVRAVTGAEWLHCLGAGWDPLDTAAWLDLGFDSVDSVAYLEDARRGRQWRAQGREWVPSRESWVKIAEANALATVQTCEGIRA